MLFLLALGLLCGQGLVVIGDELFVFFDYGFAGAFHDGIALAALGDAAPLGHLLLDVLGEIGGVVGAAGRIGLAGGIAGFVGLGLAGLFTVSLLIGRLGLAGLGLPLLLGLLLVRL